jgi:hypothetical protein
MYAVTFAAGALFGGIVLALVLRRTVKRELTGTSRRRCRRKKA